MTDLDLEQLLDDMESDRVEIQNPGGPYGQVNKPNFGQPYACDYRNPNLAAVLKELAARGRTVAPASRRWSSWPGTAFLNPCFDFYHGPLGHVQRFGVGIATAWRALEENGNPPIEFQVEDSHGVAILRRRP